MKHKSVVVTLIIVLLFMVLGNSIACTTIATEYVLNISSTEGGSVTTPGEGKYPYCAEQGERVNLVATPNTGYRFDKWTGDASTITDVNDATTIITVNNDYSIIANFKEIREYNLTISSTEGGSVTTPGEGTFNYDEVTGVNLVAKAQEGYQFVNWTGDIGTIANVNTATTTITVNDDYSITANFVKQYKLTISSTEGGSVTTPGEGTFTYAPGTVIHLVAIPDSSYRFVNWIGDVGTIAGVNTADTTITMNDDYSITAKFTWQCICP